jgi:hypothetical protein
MPTVSGRELLRLTDVSTGGIGLNASFDSRDNQINPRGEFRQTAVPISAGARKTVKVSGNTGLDLMEKSLCP